MRAAGSVVVRGSACEAVLLVVRGMGDCASLMLCRIAHAALASRRLSFVEGRLGQRASGAFHERCKRGSVFGDGPFELHDIGYGQHVLLGFAKKWQQCFAVGVGQIAELHFGICGAR